MPAVIRNPIMLYVRKNRTPRFLEIGPGEWRIPGFETLNIVPGREVDYIFDAGNILPFSSETYDIIYASHVLEHIPWYMTQDVLNEWVRILKKGGRLEIWVPDGGKICRAFVDAEYNGKNYIDLDGWYRWNQEHDPCLWASGRIFTYGDGLGTRGDPNWHRAIFSERYLMSILERAGLSQISKLKECQVRGHNHGWINMGATGVKT